MEVTGILLLRLLTLIVGDHAITRLSSPVFPPDRNASDVLERLQAKALTGRLNRMTSYVDDNDPSTPSNFGWIAVRFIVDTLARFGLLEDDLDYHLLRAAMVVIFAWFGWANTNGLLH